MVKKRIVGVVTIKDNWVVQSFGYNKYLPIGSPECVIQNLDRWGADEILVQVIDLSVASKGPDFGLLTKIGKLSLSTPLIYAGGIRDVVDAVNVIKHGADRIVIDYILRKKPETIHELASSLGSQAIIASLPVHMQDNELMVYNYDTGHSDKFDNMLLNIIRDKKIISEILLIHKDGEGYPNTFHLDLLKAFPKIDNSFIVFGGIQNDDHINLLLNQANISAVAIGNFLNYKEHAIQQVKKMAVGDNTRNPEYHINI